MTDTIKFPSGFNAYVCIGDSVETQHGPFTIRATIEHDSDTGAPWSEHDGHDTIETPRQRASRAALSDFKALRAWCNDEWFWCGIVVTVTHTESGLELASDSLWGIDANYPGSDNSHLTECAMELAETALQEARKRAKALASALLEGV